VFLNRLKAELNSLFQTKTFNLINFSYNHVISHLRVCDLSKIVKVSGMISKTTSVVAIIKSTSWECTNGCSIIRKEANCSEPPAKCSNCGGRRYNLIATEMQDIQEIELEELQEDLGDKQPQKIRIRLLDELCDKEISGTLQPGNKIEVIGIVQKTKQKKDDVEEIFKYRILAVNLSSLEEKYNTEIISEEDMNQIREIAANNPLDKLAESLAPMVHGHEEVRKALILQMVGGVSMTRPGGKKFRGRIHLLVVGDAGCAKTELSKSVGMRMPKCFRVTGDETTKAGLVAIVDRDPLLNEWYLQAGALSKANDSILILDEADKLSDEDRQGLHTPMESGEIIVNKASIHTTLKADCSILAVANPKDGAFDLSNSDRTIAKQINLPPPLMSRFDLIFVIVDKIDKDMDDAITDLIYSGTPKKDFIPIDLFRKYITYARKIEPKLLEENKTSVSNFYHQTRLKSISPDSRMKGMPITPRHFEGVLRLAQASAKVRLSDTVTSDDLKLAQELFFNSLVKIGMDEKTGIFDMARTGAGKPLNRRMKCSQVLELGAVIVSEGHPIIPDELLFERCKSAGMNKGEYEELIRELNKEGYILQIGRGWKIV
jgi:replicative DNA helicase Mcm